MIIIVDYGMGNLRSVSKAFERINVRAEVSNDVEHILKAEKIVLPGVGHFKKGIESLIKTGLAEVLNRKVIQEKVPILGICLGMQLMTDFSEEGNVPGFGWIKAKTNKFTFSTNGLKIPHIGWNSISIKKENKLLAGLNEEDLFYFVHSYFVSCENGEDILSETNYGNDFVSAISKDNIYGCQFHPEKSHDAGLHLLRNFANL